MTDERCGYVPPLIDYPEDGPQPSPCLLPKGHAAPHPSDSDEWFPGEPFPPEPHPSDSERTPRTEAGRRFVENWNLSLDQPVSVYDLWADIRAIEAESERVSLDELADALWSAQIDGFQQTSEYGDWPTLGERLDSIHGGPRDSSTMEAAAMLRSRLAAPGLPDVERLAQAIILAIETMADGTNGLLDHAPIEVARFAVREYARLSPSTGTPEA